MNNSKIDISVILPSRNEGDKVKKLVPEVIDALEKTGKTYEVFAINSPTDKTSFPTFKEFASKHKNFYAIDLSDKRAAGDGKSVQYMIGFELARGKYVIHMDTDGQDNPAQIPDFLAKLEEGYDLVVGHKQKRKDGGFYMFTSKGWHAVMSMFMGIDLHDMNCGFKAYRGHVVKRLNLKGRWYRYIPSILSAKGYRITEIPIENRKREWGKSNFSFFNRLQGGVFDMLTVATLNRIGGTPMYFFGWLSIGFVGLFIALIALSLVFLDLYLKLLFAILATGFGVSAIFSYLIGLKIAYERSLVKTPLQEYGIREIFPSHKRVEIEA
ncbi:glycosyltransferase [Candidatus Nomurabacteria bacterium]|nr:glycosyltransferase [Candidatus Nomurabacteria bacterium]